MFVFKSKWVDNNIGVQTNDFGFTLVDCSPLASAPDRASSIKR